jgi:hypothetical protein
MAPTPRTTYWEQLYQHLSPEQVSWYEPQATTSLQLLTRTSLSFDAPILDVGSGHSPFLTQLLARGYVNLIAADCSATALDQHRQQLPAEQAERVLWVVDDVTDSQYLHVLDPVMLWHDRGTLHGLLTPAQVGGYRRLLDHMVMAHGWALLGVRLPGEQALSDAGLLVHPYDAAGLIALLGESYVLHQTIEEVHITPEGEPQPYLFALFRRNETSRQGAWRSER